MTSIAELSGHGRWINLGGPWPPVPSLGTLLRLATLLDPRHLPRWPDVCIIGEVHPATDRWRQLTGCTHRARISDLDPTTLCVRLNVRHEAHRAVITASYRAWADLDAAVNTGHLRIGWDEHGPHAAHLEATWVLINIIAAAQSVEGVHQ